MMLINFLVRKLKIFMGFFLGFGFVVYFFVGEGLNSCVGFGCVYVDV